MNVISLWRMYEVFSENIQINSYEDFKYHLAVSNKALRKHIFQNALGKAPLPTLNPHKF